MAGGTWRRRVKVTLLIICGVLATVVVCGVLFMKLSPQFGDAPAGERLERMERSPNYRDGKFHNPVPTQMGGAADMARGAVDYFRGGETREPGSPLPSVKLDRAAFGEGNQQLRLAWLGHSTVLINMDGVVLLTDPVFGKGRTSPVPMMGPKPFAYTEDISLEDLPVVDLVLISHDHYDHLDHRTVLALRDRVKKFFVPLGVAARLEGWGVPLANIVELDWGEQGAHAGLTLTAAPSRHFSGRGALDRDGTLWASWIIRGSQHRVFFGGDSGYFDGFKTIGEEHGPFDVTMLECGAYSKYWPAIHMMPEQTAAAHRDLRGKLLLPIHWGKFNLSLHGWTEPVDRLLDAAKQNGATVITPRVGEVVLPGEVAPTKRWWRDLRSRN